MPKLKRNLLPLMLLTLSGTATSAELSAQIYNGVDTTTETFPSIATLYYDAIDYSGLYGMYCGATILDEQHVLTAAHCLYDGNGNLNEDYLVYTSVAIQMENESQFSEGSIEIVRASEFYPHSDYVDSSSSSSTSWPNDIAIIKLASAISVDSSDYVTRAASESYRVDGEAMIAVGHGYTEDGDEDELLQTTLNYEAGECDLGNISDSQICMTGELDEETGVRNSTCSGDSGGPLYWLNDDSEYVQAGITSYGWSGCYNEDSDDTSVFTEVVDYKDWIDNVLAGEETPAYTVTDEERDDYDPSEWSYPDFNIREISEDSSDESSSNTSTSSSGGGSGVITTLLLCLLCFRKRVLEESSS